MDSVPLIIGHRGASALAPENTLAAFEAAYEGGADGVEFDVRLARDQRPVVIHDATLKRTTLREGRVEQLSSAELAALDAGTWFNLRFPRLADERFSRERVPTLARVLEQFGACSRVLYVEMKCDDPSSYAPLAAAVVADIREHNLADRAVVKSFAHASIREVKRLAPEIRTAALFERTWSRPTLPTRTIISRALDCGADEISLHSSLARRSVVEAARRHGLAVIVWTVDTRAWLRRALALNLRAVIANNPASMKRALEELTGQVWNF